MTLARDTSAAARRVQLEAFRRLDGPARVEMALQMSDDTRAVTLSGIRHRHPNWSEATVHRELLRLLLGRELAARVVERSSVDR